MWCLDPYVCNGFLVSLLEFCRFFQFTVVQLDSEVQSQNIWRVRILVSCQTVRFPLGSQNIIADMLLQHVAATDHSLCAGRATCCATCFSEKLFRVYWSLCLRNRVLLLQRFAQIQIHLILRYLWPFVAATNFHLHKATYHSNAPPRLVTATFYPVHSSLHSKLVRLVSEQRKTEERDFRFRPREKWNESAVFDSRCSFFVPKPHGKACYAG